MNYNEANSELFDRFINGELSAEELAAFNERLASDKAFAEAFSLHKLLAEGIRDHARTELKSYIREKGEIHYWGGNIWPRSMTYAAAAVFVLFAGLYLVLRNYTKPDLEKEIAVHTDMTVPESANSDTVITPPSAEAREFEAPLAVVPDIEEMPAAESVVEGLYDAEDQDISNEWKEDVAVSKDDASEKYNILSEKMLGDTVISAPVLLAVLNEVPATANYELSRNQVSGQSRTKTPSSANNNTQPESLKKYKYVAKDTAVSKPEADSKIANRPDEAKTLILEYWYSPVNFIGYHYSNSTIKLYGIKRGEGRLFVYNNEVYLRHDGKVYLLSVCPGSCVFITEKNTEITNLILRQN